MAKIPPSETPIIDRATGRISLEWYAALQRLVSEIASFSSGGVSTFEGRSGAVTSQSGDYTASEVTNVPAGNIAATDVQAALNELDTDKVANTRQVISGAGLTGGGDLSADRTLAVGAGTGITVNADTVQTNDAQIVHSALSGYVANEHIDHTGVTLTAGNGLTGGGTIAANRTFAVGAGTGIAVNADDVQLSHLGIQNLTDPGADRLMFWDESSNFVDWLTLGTNLSITGTTINASGGSGSGLVLQSIASNYTSNADLSTTIPYDDTTPTSSEGTEIISQAITLASTSSRVQIDVTLNGCVADLGDRLIAAVFRGTTCINAQAVAPYEADDNPLTIAMCFIDSPATLGSVTYSVRVGPDTGSSPVRLNGTTAARRFGGTAKSTLILSELAS